MSTRARRQRLRVAGGYPGRLELTERTESSLREERDRLLAHLEREREPLAVSAGDRIA